MNYGRRGGAVPERGRRHDAQPVRQHHGAARTATSGTPPRAPASPSAATASSSRDRGREDARQTGVARRCPGLEGHVAPDVPALRPRHPRQPARRRLARGVPAVRARRRAAARCRSSASPTTTPRARARLPDAARDVADNDLALGRIVEASRQSRFWKELAIFVRRGRRPERPGPRRRPPLGGPGASPYTRRGAVDSTLYTTSACCARWS